MELDPTSLTPESLMEDNANASQAEEAYAKTLAEYERLADLSEDILSEIKTGLEQVQQGKSPESRLERLARCDERWRVHRELFNDARAKAYQDRAAAKNADRTWRSRQSALSLLREEVKRSVIT